MLACLLLGLAASAWGTSAGAPTALVGLSITATPADTEVRVVTDGPQPPSFSSAVLAQPTRVVVDLWNVRIASGFSVPAPAAGTGIRRITASGTEGVVPVTHLAFELAGAASAVRYRVLPSTQDGSIVVRLSRSPTAAARAKHAPARPRASAKRRAAAETRPTPARVPGGAKAVPPSTPQAPAPAAPVPAAPSSQPAAPAGEAPSSPPVPAARGERRSAPPAAPVPAGEPPPSSRAPRQPHRARNTYLSVIFATLLGGGVASAGWKWIAVHGRAQGRRAWLRNALASNDREQWASALRSVRTWLPSEVRAVDDLLVGVAEDTAHPAAEAARSVLRWASPLGLLARRVEHGGPAARAQAARVIGLHGGDSAAALLMAAAESGPEAVREAALDGLARLVCEESVRPLLQALVDSKARRPTRAVALQVLNRAGPPSGPALRKALADPDQAVRCAALEALTIVRPAGSVQAVVRLLSDPAEPVRAMAAQALGVLGLDGDTSGDLLHALGDPSPEVQEKAAMALAQLGGGHLEELLLSLDRRACEDPGFSPSGRLLETVATQAGDPLPSFAHVFSCFNRGFARDLARAVERAGKLDAWVARMATADASESGVIAAILQAAARVGVSEPVSRGIASPVPSVREACARILGETVTASSASLLRPLLSQPYEPLRAVAAEALGRVGGTDETEALIAALTDPSPMVRAAAAGGLARLLPGLQQEAPSTQQLEAVRSATAALVAAAHDSQASVRKAVVEALGSADPEEAIHALLEVALRDEDQPVRQVAMAALARFADRRILAILLVEVLNSEDAALRARAVDILAHVGDATISHLMIDSLQDADAGVRAIAGRGLWDVISPEQCQPLVPFLNSPDPKVRAGVVGALGRTRWPEWTEVLAAAAEDPDPRVRAAIMNALARFGPGAEHGLQSVLVRCADSDAFVRARAVEAAWAISPESEDTALRVLQLAGDPDPGVRRSVSHCLLKYCQAGIYGPLLELLASQDLNESLLAALAEAEEGVLHQLLGRAQQTSAEVGTAVVAALSEVLRGRWTVADLRLELDSLDTEARLAGLEGLSILRSGEAVAEMARLLSSDPSRRVRLRAAQLLSPHLENPAVLQALRRAAQADPDPAVRQTATEVGRASLFRSAAV